MKSTQLRRISAAFSGGVAAMLLAMTVFWLLQRSRLLPHWPAALLLPLNSSRLLVEGAGGGLWGLQLLLPLLKSRTLLRGLFFSLAPLLYLFIVTMPAEGHGLFGLHAGYRLPLSLLAYWGVWGITAAFWYESAT